MSTPLKALIDRLTPTARRAVEGAASRALSRTHFEVEIEHVVLAILAQDDNAGVAALHSLGLSLDQLEKELDSALDRFRTGNTRNPVLSSWLPKWLEKAWLMVSAELGQDSISTLDLLLVLVRDEALRATLQGSSATLAKMDTQRALQGYVALRQHGHEAASNTQNMPAGDEAEEMNLDQPAPRRGSPGLDKYTID
ncbi:Clp protease N-terminal domain-containing protein, partial [Janthinobacterium sp.]|uniref:Clp protease N-terminal domain-containing protein n=1 Tax=Janthinobacterium sp. TaxID=1871054 RepID=UPI0025848457